MRLPGFTAESSLNRTREDYMSRIVRLSKESGRVLAQFFFCRGNYCCNEWGYCIYRGRVLQ